MSCLHYPLLVLCLLAFPGCNEAQEPRVAAPVSHQKSARKLNIKNHKDFTVDEGMLVELHGYDLRPYGPIEVEYLDVPLRSLQLKHVLALAVESCDVGLVADLLERKVDADASVDGDQLITGVAFCEDNALEIAKLFVQAGADINGADQDNDSFLSYAIADDQPQLVAYILAQGGDLLQRDTNLGCLPVFSIKSTEMYNLLLRHNANVLDSCENGRTLLHIAARLGLVEVAKDLLRRGIDKAATDKAGLTALDYAMQAKEAQMVALLK